jgi:Predicted ATPase (AAA+ superfamily)
VPKGNIIHLNLESSDFYKIKDHEDLSSYIKKQMSDTGRHYIFLDEIQEVKNWEKTVNALMIDSDSDIYITGSNSRMLSSELSTYLTGRFTTISMLPLSFKEFTEMNSYAGYGVRDLFELFTVYGGFPGADPVRGDAFARTSLKDLYSSILFWDVASRGDVRNNSELDRLMKYMMINIGNPISVNGITKGMGDINRATVEKYLRLMEQSFMLYRADRFDLRGTSLNPSPKYYAVDQGIRNMLLGFDTSDVGRILENVVFLELIRRGNEVMIGKWDAKEVDFVASLPEGGKEYFQVCYDINLEDTRERELSPLRGIKDSFPKTVLVMHPLLSSVTSEGIRIKNVVDWLLE